MGRYIFKAGPYLKLGAASSMRLEQSHASRLVVRCLNYAAAILHLFHMTIFLIFTKYFPFSNVKPNYLGKSHSRIYHKKVNCCASLCPSLFSNKFNKEIRKIGTCLFLYIVLEHLHFATGTWWMCFCVQLCLLCCTAIKIKWTVCYKF